MNRYVIALAIDLALLAFIAAVPPHNLDWFLGAWVGVSLTDNVRHTRAEWHTRRRHAP